MSAPAPELVEVRLRQVPVPLWARAQQHTDELRREFALAALETGSGDGTGHELPARLTQLMDALNRDFAGVSTAQEEELVAAAENGRPVIEELTYAVPPAAAPASQALGEILDEADRFCRDGEHLLTLAAADDLVRFRHWFLSEFVRQARGEAAVPWPDYDGSWPASA